MKPSSPEKNRVWFWCSTIFRHFRLGLSRRLEPLGLTPPQYGVLMLLDHHRSLSVTEIARLAEADSPTICRILDRLEKHGFVTRAQDVTDRRCLTMGLSVAGRALSDTCRSYSQEIEEAMLVDFSAAERALLLSMLQRLLHNVLNMNATDHRSE